MKTIRLLGKCLRYLKCLVYGCVAFLTERIQKNKVFVMTFDDAFTCNPKYVVEELIRRGSRCDIVWVTSKDREPDRTKFPKEVRLVRRESYSMFREMASAKFWIDNGLNCLWYFTPKKRDQIYIQTWHGSMGLKRVHGSHAWMLRAKRCSKVTDFCISNSRFEDNVYQESFWRGVRSLPFGHPRNDIFFSEKKVEEAKKKIRDQYGIPEGKKICLYAPTFRDTREAADISLDYNSLSTSLSQRFGGEWCIMVRRHFRERGRIDVSTPDSICVNASDYDDIQELLCAADAGVTDYSSWVYDYILLGRPAFLYVYDLEKYIDMRGFYYPIWETPFQIARTSSELLDNILKFDENDYKSRVADFLKKRGSYEEGKAAAKVADILEGRSSSEQQPWKELV